MRTFSYAYKFKLLSSSLPVSILLLGSPPASQDAVDANLQKLTQLVNKESNLIEKVLLETCLQISLRLITD